jgi:hypothetical protein
MLTSVSECTVGMSNDIFDLTLVKDMSLLELRRYLNFFFFCVNLAIDRFYNHIVSIQNSNDLMRDKIQFRLFRNLHECNNYSRIWYFFQYWLNDFLVDITLPLVLLVQLLWLTLLKPSF